MLNNKKKWDSSELLSENITSVIAEDCIIDGTIECKAFIKVDGHALRGVTSTGGVIVGQKGYIKGDIKAKELIVFGKVDGDVYVDSLILRGTGFIVGDIQVKKIQIETGAVYKGTVSMEQFSTPASENVKSDPAKGKRSI
jgi:cytoskeletal protein CcmA (bactofilin family)